MKIHNLIQGTPEWKAYRIEHQNASDAPAMMGCSPYKTRSQLMHELHTGLTAEVDAATQSRFDDGHIFEALARPFAEEIIGEDLYPCVGSEGKRSASFDGLTMLYDKAWEHKSLNDALRAALPESGIGDESVGAALPMLYRVQMEQQSEVSGCELVLFTASKWSNGELVEMRHCWYRPDPELRAKILAGWEQFEADLADYVPAEIAAEVVAAPVESLPTVSVRMEGSIAVISNLTLFGDKLRAFVEKIDRNPSTDQAFADAEAAIKTLQTAQDALEHAEAAALAQTSSIEEMRRTVADYAGLARSTRLALEKIVKARKEQIKVEIVTAGRDALLSHIEGLNKRLGKSYMPGFNADFAGVIKGKRTVTSLRDAVDTELARAKIEANAIADRIQINLATLTELASDHKFLFADAGQIVLKANDDLTMLVKLRITEHKAAEAARLEAEREKIRAEEAAKLAAEAARKEREEAAAEAEKAAEIARQKEKFEREQAAAHNTPAQESQQVLKAEAPAPDATDREAPATTSPSVGSMGAGQAADAAPSCKTCSDIGLVGSAAQMDAVDCPDCTPAPAVTHADVVAPAVGKFVEKASNFSAIHAELGSVPSSRVIHPAAQSFRNETPTLALGEICKRLGFTVTDGLLDQLGYPAEAVIKGAKLRRQSQFGDICNALIRHIECAAADAVLAA